MATVYVRNVPDDVVERLEMLAGRAGMSVSAYCARALSEVSRAAANPGILDALPHHAINAEAVVDALTSGRTERPANSIQPRTSRARRPRRAT